MSFIRSGLPGVIPSIGSILFSYSLLGCFRYYACITSSGFTYTRLPLIYVFGILFGPILVISYFVWAMEDLDLKIKYK